MDSKEARQNIKTIGSILLVIGILGVIGSLIYWDNVNLYESILKILSGIACLYFGYLTIISINNL
jgi:hypothetical protein